MAYKTEDYEPERSLSMENFMIVVVCGYLIMEQNYSNIKLI
jgi:hypothetical protein